MANPQTLERNQAAALPAEEDGLYEVVNGERKELEPMGFFEVTLASELGGFLREFVKIKKLGLVVNEGLFVLDSEKNLKRRPDVAFISYSRCPDPIVPREESCPVAPDLAVEIVSPSNLAEEIETKVNEYLQAGVGLVWVFHPNSGRVYAYDSPTTVKVLERTDEIDGGEVLPGFRLQIEKLFEALIKPE